MGRFFCAIIAGLAIFAVPLAAQETRVGEEGFESPPATLADIAWLIGQWQGAGIGGATATESWLPPTGPTMVGTFVQQSEDGAVMFTELMYLTEEDGSLVLRLKHFNEDLTGWEAQDEMESFRLLAIEPCAAYFHELTIRCTDAEAASEGVTIAVRMQSGGELAFRYLPMK